MKTKESLPLVSFVIPTHNRINKLQRLLNTIEKSDYDKDKIEIIVVDDASNDNTYEIINNKYGHDKRFSILRNEKVELVSRSRNRGIGEAKGKYIFFVDDDVYLKNDALSELVRYFEENEGYGALGPLIYEHDYPDKIWSAGGRMNFWTGIAFFPYKGRRNFNPEETIIECDCLPTCFMVGREAIEKAGCFNSELFPFFHEELDFCIKLRFLGFKNATLPSANVWHERAKGSLRNNYDTYYYGTRNIIIAHKLWSKNLLQYFTSRVFSVTVPFCVNIVKNLYNKNSYSKQIPVMIKGIKDGIKISKKLESYKLLLKENKSIAFRE